jgi:uncharacterized membrane protein HdeD (DUF308 family)
VRADWDLSSSRIFAAVGFVLVVLKLSDSLNWSWWWVTFVLWFPMALYVFLSVIIGILMILSGVVEGLSAIQKKSSGTGQPCRNHPGNP